MRGALSLLSSKGTSIVPLSTIKLTTRRRTGDLITGRAVVDVEVVGEGLSVVNATAVLVSVGSG